MKPFSFNLLFNNWLKSHVSTASNIEAVVFAPSTTRAACGCGLRRWYLCLWVRLCSVEARDWTSGGSRPSSSHIHADSSARMAARRRRLVRRPGGGSQKSDISGGVLFCFGGFVKTKLSWVVGLSVISISSLQRARANRRHRPPCVRRVFCARKHRDPRG